MSAKGMPPNLLALFAPRPPLPYLEPVGKRNKKPVYTGLDGLTELFDSGSPPPVESFETPKQRQERRRAEKLEEHRRKQQEAIEQYNPHDIECSTKNPFATLFVARLSYETTEKKLKKEFETFGPIRRVKIITDFEGKSRGYAFIEYELEADLKAAYKSGDGRKIDGRRVLVDVERSRTVPKWIPRRLGSGKGPARFTPKPPDRKEAPAGTGPTSGSSSGLSTSSSHYYSALTRPGMDRRPGGMQSRGGTLGSGYTGPGTSGGTSSSSSHYYSNSGMGSSSSRGAGHGPQGGRLGGHSRPMGPSSSGGSSSGGYQQPSYR